MIALAMAGQAVSAGPPIAPMSPSATIADALSRLESHLDIANAEMGEDQALDLGNRLAGDLEDYDEILGTYGPDDAYWNGRMRADADLDASIVDQVMSRQSLPIAGVRGLAERLILSKVDGTLQPFALYVPANISPAPTLVVLLHGRPQYESDILSRPDFRTLADATGTIVAAPYGRGNYNYWGIATDDIYQTADEVASAYHVDPHRIFLVGYSMGGFSVFKVGPVHAGEWAAIMCIAGSILNSETQSVRATLQNKPFYVVTGTADASIPTQYPQLTAIYLAGTGFNAGLYVQSGGTHSVATLMPMLTAAWDDMVRGVVTHRPSTTSQDEGLSDLGGMPMGVDVPNPTRP